MKAEQKGEYKAECSPGEGKRRKRKQISAPVARSSMRSPLRTHFSVLMNAKQDQRDEKKQHGKDRRQPAFGERGETGFGKEPEREKKKGQGKDEKKGNRAYHRAVLQRIVIKQPRTACHGKTEQKEKPLPEAGKRGEYLPEGEAPEEAREQKKEKKQRAPPCAGSGNVGAANARLGKQRRCGGAEKQQYAAKNSGKGKNRHGKASLCQETEWSGNADVEKNDLIRGEKTHGTPSVRSRRWCRKDRADLP